MNITLRMGIFDKKEDYLRVIELLEFEGFKVFDIGCFDHTNKLSECVLVKDNDMTNIHTSDDIQ